MKKSFISKKGSCISFITGSGKDESSLELMRISLKKEADRKDKLEKLSQKYDEIHSLERNHVKNIKANIIELKDVVAVPKIKFLVDPNIYVDNNLTIETRQFLCMLLNTFYKRYSENSEYQKQAVKMNDHIKVLLKSISHNEELLFKVQKSNINSQVQMEGELLGEKARQKDVTQKGKDLCNQEKRIKTIWTKRKIEYDEKKNKVDSLNQIMLDLESKVIGLTQKINEGQEIKQGNQDKITGEMAYQAKFEEEVNLLKEAVTSQFSRASQLRKRIKEKKVRVDKLKGHINYDNSRHEVNIKILELQEVKSSTKYKGAFQLLEISKTFQKAMNQSYA